MEKTEKQIYKTKSAYIIPSDFPDPDVIRIDDTYYMISTTMHFMPGCVILKSYNLCDWEFVSYVYDELDLTEGQTLNNKKGIYGKGMWAASLRYANGLFHVLFVANDTHKTYLYTSERVEGPWKKQIVLGFYHDNSVLFDDDGKVYVISGNTEIRITEMKEDLSGAKEGGLNKVIIQDEKDKVVLGYEGCHFYKINGKYYIFMIHMPKDKMRTQACYVSENVSGPYKGCDVLQSDLNNWNSGVAQGGIVQSKDGKWYGILFQDHGALGRIPVLVPVEFINGFPVFGINGTAPETLTVLDNKPNYIYEPLYGSGFTTKDGTLKHFWQWNHTPDYKLIKIKNDVLKIKTDAVVKNVVQAKNTLTQRTYTEKCNGSVTVDASVINEGDYAGFCALEGEYAFIAITKQNGKLKLVLANHKIPYTPWTMGVYDDEEPVILKEKEIENSEINLQMDFDLTKEKQQVKFSYFNKNQNENQKTNFGEPVKLRYTLDQFVGVRFAMFIYSTKETGGEASFTNFKMNLS